MFQTTVWAFKAIAELGGQTGFVAVESGIAAELIAAGKVQDPRVGGTSLKRRRNAVFAHAAEYGTKEIKAAPKIKKGKG
jgi:hypothetical protein